MKIKLKYFTAMLTLAPFLISHASSPTGLEIAKEYPKSNEKETTRGLIKSLKEDTTKKYKKGEFRRAAHPKQHACVDAKVIVPPLASNLRVGMFKTPKEYSAIIRYSTASATISSDKDKGILGMAIKIFGVDGKKLIKDKYANGSQDILLLSHPVMPIANAEDFLKVVNNAALFFVNPFHFKELKIALDSRKNYTSPLDIRYWSTTPYLFGKNQAVKYSVAPCSASNNTLPRTLSDNYLRQEMSKQLRDGEYCFNLMVQFQTDADSMLIEDATNLWDESISPFYKVAKIIIPKQKFDSTKDMKSCEDISMNPWHSLAVHRPLGSINRARKDVYIKLSKFRED